MSFLCLHVNGCGRDRDINLIPMRHNSMNNNNNNDYQTLYNTNNVLKTPQVLAQSVEFLMDLATHLLFHVKTYW